MVGKMCIVVLLALCCEPMLAHTAAAHQHYAHSPSQGVCSGLSEYPYTLPTVLKLVNAIANISPHTKEKLRDLNHQFIQASPSSAVPGAISMLEVKESPLLSLWYVIAGIIALGSMQSGANFFCSVTMSMLVLVSSICFVTFLTSNRWFFEDLLGYDITVKPDMVRAMAYMRFAFGLSIVLALVSLGCVSTSGNSVCQRTGTYAYMMQWPVTLVIIMGLVRSRSNALSLFVKQRGQSTSPNGPGDASANSHMFRGVNNLGMIPAPLKEQPSPSPSPSPSRATAEMNDLQALITYRTVFPTFASRTASYVQYSHMAKFGILIAFLMVFVNNLLCSL